MLKYIVARATLSLPSAQRIPAHSQNRPKSNPCHTYKKCACKSFICHTYKNKRLITPLFATHPKNTGVGSVLC